MEFNKVIFGIFNIEMVERFDCKGGIKNIVYLLILGVEVIYIVASIIVLSIDGGDCNMPIRAWLLTLLIVYIFHFLLLILSSIYSNKFPRKTSLVLTIISAVLGNLLSLFAVFWFILGNI